MGRPSFMPQRKPRSASEQDHYAIADSYVPKVARAFETLRRNIKNSTDWEEVQRGAERGNSRLVMGAIPTSPIEPPFQRFARDFEKILGKIIEEAGEDGLKRLGIDGQISVKAEVDIGVKISPAAKEFMRGRSAKLVSDISKKQKQALREALADNFDRAMRPEETLAAIERTVGHTTRSAAAAQKRYDAMIAGGSSPAQAKKAADRYGAQLLRGRAKTIARTETTAAQSVGLHEAWKAANDAGELPEGVKRKWVSMDDDRMSDICEELDGQTAALTEPFYSGVLGEYVDQPPAHPNCRSTVVLVFE